MTARKDDAATGGESGQTGSATVLVLAMLAVVFAVGAVVGSVAEAIVTRHRSAAAADAAALAAALHVAGPAPCGQARRIAALDGARLDRCDVSGAIVTVRVSTATPAWLAWLGRSFSRARAGPAADNRARTIRNNVLNSTGGRNLKADVSLSDHSR